MENQYYKRKELFQMTPDCFTDWISSQEQIAGRLLGLAAKKRQVLIAGVPGGEELQELNEILQEENEMLIVLREIENGEKDIRSVPEHWKNLNWQLAVHLCRPTLKN